MLLSFCTRVTEMSNILLVLSPEGLSSTSDPYDVRLDLPDHVAPMTAPPVGIDGATS